MTDKEKRDSQMAIIAHIGQGWLPSKHSNMSLRAFIEYIRSDYRTLPYAGGWLDQPKWIIDDFELYHNLLDFHMINESWGDDD